MSLVFSVSFSRSPVDWQMEPSQVVKRSRCCRVPPRSSTWFVFVSVSAWLIVISDGFQHCQQRAGKKTGTETQLTELNDRPRVLFSSNDSSAGFRACRSQLTSLASVTAGEEREVGRGGERGTHRSCDGNTRGRGEERDSDGYTHEADYSAMDGWVVVLVLVVLVVVVAACSERVVERVL